MEILLEENPFGGVGMYGYDAYYDNPWYGEVLGRSNPKKGKSAKRRNPVAKGLATTFKGWSQNVRLEEVGAGVAGLAASTMIPGAIMKDPAVTSLQKIYKIGLAVGSAIVAGMAANTVSKQAGRAAVLGGLIGAGAQAIGAFTPIQIGSPRLLTGSRVRPLGASERQPASVAPEEVIVTVT